jgi:hypothetical protein
VVRSRPGTRLPGIDDGRLQLETWANFYLVTSTAATTLVGLLFVVITLAADRQPGEAKQIRLYLTPTVVCFGLVLLMAALLTIPAQSRVSAALCAAGVGTVSLSYSLSLLRGGPGKGRFRERSDAWPYIVLPAAAYGLLIVAAPVLFSSSVRSGLTLISVAILGLIALRLTTALAPVLCTNVDRVSLNKLYLDLERAGLERRLAWVCENTLTALESDLLQELPRTGRGIQHLAEVGYRQCSTTPRLRSSRSSRQCHQSMTLIREVGRHWSITRHRAASSAVGDSRGHLGG